MLQSGLCGGMCGALHVACREQLLAIALLSVTMTSGCVRETPTETFQIPYHPATEYTSITASRLRLPQDLTSSPTFSDLNRKKAKMFRQSIARQARLFSTSTAFRKSVMDTAKDAIKNVDKTVAQGAVKGIETAGTFPSLRTAMNAKLITIT